MARRNCACSKGPLCIQEVRNFCPAPEHFIGTIADRSDISLRGEWYGLRITELHLLQV